MPKTKSKETYLTDSDGDSEENWDDVEESSTKDNDESVPISENVEISLDLPDVVKRQQRKNCKERAWIEMYVKRLFNQNKREIHMNKHKVHLLSLLGVGIVVNEICNSQDLQALALSLLSTKCMMSDRNMTLETIYGIYDWAQSKFVSTCCPSTALALTNLKSKPALIHSILSGGEQLEHILDLVLILIVVFRSLGIPARLVMSFQPTPFKPPTEKESKEWSQLVYKQQRQLHDLLTARAVTESAKCGSGTEEAVAGRTIPQVDGAHDNDDRDVSRRRSGRRRARRAPRDKTIEAPVVASRYDFQPRTAAAGDEKVFGLCVSPSQKLAELAKKCERAEAGAEPRGDESNSGRRPSAVTVAAAILSYPVIAFTRLCSEIWFISLHRTIRYLNNGGQKSWYQNL